jgi:uncharacterized lipoprotein YajG
MKRPLVIVTALLTLLLTGCVTGRRELTLTVPAGTVPANAKGRVYLVAVTDDREFQNKPSDPSTPSIDGDVTAISPAQRDHMIGRQRNGFGHAMGDISLSNNDTVTQRVRQLVTEGFRRSGYEVVSDPAGAIPVTVSVDKFWAWFTPGFFALTFEVKIAAKITLKTPASSTSFTALGYGKNHGQVVKDGNWVEAFEPAFDDFLDAFKHEMEKVDLH